MRKPSAAVVDRPLHVSEAIEVIAIPNVKPPRTSTLAADAEVGHLRSSVPSGNLRGFRDASDDLFIPASSLERSNDFSRRRLYAYPGNARWSSFDLRAFRGFQDFHSILLVRWHIALPLSSGFRTAFQDDSSVSESSLCRWRGVGNDRPHSDTMTDKQTFVRSMLQSLSRTLVDSGDLAHDLQRSFRYRGSPFVGHPALQDTDRFAHRRRVVERNLIPFTVIVNMNTKMQKARPVKKGRSCDQWVRSIPGNSRKESGFRAIS
jgi:hypothetical protein